MRRVRAAHPAARISITVGLVWLAHHLGRPDLHPGAWICGLAWLDTPGVVGLDVVNLLMAWPQHQIAKKKLDSWEER